MKILRSAFLLIFLFSVSKNFAQLTPKQNLWIDSLQNVISLTVDDSVKVGLLIELDSVIRNKQMELHKNVLHQIDEICSRNISDSSLSDNYFLSKTGWLYLVKGADLYALEFYDSSIFCFEKAYRIFSGVEDWYSLIVCNTNLGNSHLKLSNFALARQKYLNSANLAQDFKFETLESRAYERLGEFYQLNDNYDSAFFYYDKSLMLLENKNSTSKVSIEYSIGKLYHELGEPDKATQYLGQALIDLNSSEMTFLKSKILNTLALVYKSLGQYARAMSIFNDLKDYYESVNNIVARAYMCGNISVLYDLMGDFKSASYYGHESLKIFQQNKNAVMTAKVETNLGALFYRFNMNDSAVYYFNNAIEKLISVEYIKDAVFAKSNLGSVYLELDMADEAMELYNECYLYYDKIKNTKLKAISMVRIGDAHFYNKNYESAIIWLDSAQTYFIESHNNYELRNSMDGMILSLFYLHRMDKCIDQLKILMDIIYFEMENNFFTLAENQKEHYFNEMNADLNILFDITLNKESNNLLNQEALNMVIRTKGITLKSSTLLRSYILESGDEVLVDEYKNWMKLKKELNNEGGWNDEINKQIVEYEKALIQKSGAFSDFNKLKKGDWIQVRNSLQSDECAIEFVHFKSVLQENDPVIYAAFIILPDIENPIFVQLCTENELNNILGAFQGNNLSFIEKVYGKKSEAKKDLYEKIWQPLEPYLQGVKTVYYSPSGLLHKVSFAAICKEQDVYLSDVYNFRQMGSTGNLAFENNTQFGDLENFLLMGGVQYNSDTTEKEIWNYLPGSLAETDAINSYLNKKKYGVNYFKETNASESVFKEKIASSSIVHIATHGFFFPDPEQVREEMKSEKESESEQDLKFRGTTNYANWSFVNNKNPLMRSGIVLANANDVWQRNPLAEGEDGILTAQEVSNLDLRNTKLVVLSACETGLGDIKGSEGVYGLQRAFKMAGVKYLIMSLWQVPDKETSEFMILFYKNLIKEKDIPTAFQKTQKLMREKYDPYYWGAFVLIE